MSQRWVCPMPLSLRFADEVVHEKMVAGASLDAEASSSTKCSVNSSNHSGRSCDRLPSAASMFSFLFLFSVSVQTSNRSLRDRPRVL